MPTADEQNLAAKRKANGIIQKALERAIRTGTKYPGARYFMWGDDTLYYGLNLKKSPGQLSGNYVEVCAAGSFGEGYQKAWLKRLMKKLNEEA